MSNFCCGASKVGTIASISQDDIWVHNVPSLYCPVCKNVEVHPKMKDNFEVIADIADRDGIRELDFKDYIHKIDEKELFEECSTVDHGNQTEVMESQIDIALDLLSFARNTKDTLWESKLKKRLSALSNLKDVTKNH